MTKPDPTEAHLYQQPANGEPYSQELLAVIRFTCEARQIDSTHGNKLIFAPWILAQWQGMQIDFYPDLTWCWRLNLSVT